MNKEIEYTPEELANEEWRNVNIPEYHDYYMVSNLGRVKSLPRTYIKKNGRRDECKGRILKHVDRNGLGYMGVGMSANGKKAIFYVHRLVAMAFLENDDPQHKTMVNHKDENPGNNRVTNLEFCTPEYNSNYGT